LIFFITVGFMQIVFSFSVFSFSSSKRGDLNSNLHPLPLSPPPGLSRALFVARPLARRSHPTNTRAPGGAGFVTFPLGGSGSSGRLADLVSPPTVRTSPRDGEGLPFILLSVRMWHLVLRSANCSHTSSRPRPPFLREGSKQTVLTVPL